MKDFFVKITVLATLVLLFASTQVKAKLIDKTVLVIDDMVVTRSEVNHIRKTLQLRSSILRGNYKPKMSDKEIVDQLITVKVMQSKLEEMGYNLSDDIVENSISSDLKMMNTDRNGLKAFLGQNKLSYGDYFNISKEKVIYGYFVRQVIVPLVTVTDQEVKNSYIKQNLKSKTISLTYNLVDYSIPKANVKKGKLGKFQAAVKKLHNNGVKSNQYSNLTSITLDDMREEDFNKKVGRALKVTDEGDFTKPFLLNGSYHVFFIDTKVLSESSDFAKKKTYIKNQLLEKYIGAMTKTWIDGQKSQHFIKYSL